MVSAERRLARAESVDPPFSEWEWEIALARAELSEERGSPLGDVFAEVHFRRSIALVAAQHAATLDRSAFLVADHRAPYDGLISLLARQGRWRDALAVVLDQRPVRIAQRRQRDLAERADPVVELDTRRPAARADVPSIERGIAVVVRVRVSVLGTPRRLQLPRRDDAGLAVTVAALSGCVPAE